MTPRHRTRLVRPTLLALLLALLASVALVSSPASAAPYCGIRWGSLPKVGGTPAGSELVGVRTGRHACYDRLVVDLRGGGTGYWVEYVPRILADGSGKVVPVSGGARLQVTLQSPAYDANGAPTYQPRDPAHLSDVSGYRTFRQVAWAGTFEGQSSIGVGVRARLPYRVFVLPGPGTGSRLVVDVAHHW